jgi:hypothetical protein
MPFLSDPNTPLSPNLQRAALLNPMTAQPLALWDVYNNMNAPQPGASGDYSGMPGYPGFTPAWNPGMSMAPQVQQELSGIDMSGLNNAVTNFQDMAQRQGPSAWAQLAGQQQNALAQNEIERGQNQANAAEAGALNNLAMTGGLSSGARERASLAGQKNMLDMSQNVQRQNALNQLQIGVNDQQNKMQEMGMLPGMELQALQPQFQKQNILQNAQQQDIANQMNENQYQNEWNQNLYNQQMQAWAAGKQANATMNSGKK